MKRFTGGDDQIGNVLEGLVEIEQWEVDLRHEVLPRDDPNARRHPLFQPLIVEKLFGLLEHEEILSCRLVCHTWRNVLKASLDISTRVSIPGRSSAKRFVHLMKNPQAQFPFRSLILRCVEMDNEDVVQLLDTYGHSLRELTLWMINLNSLSFLFLPIWCPNLISLTLHLEGATLYGADLTETIKYSPTFLREAWIRPFPSLKALSFLENLKVYQDEDGMGQFFLSIFEKCRSIRHLSLGNVLTNTWTLIAPKMAQCPELMRNLEFLEISLNNIQLESWENFELGLKVLEILTIDWHTSPGAFSRFLRGISKTLETLTIEESYTCPNPAELFKIIFPCEMNSLMTLTIAAVPEVFAMRTQHKNETCYDNVFKKFPNLKECGFLTVTEDKELGNQFWAGIFPDKSSKNSFINLNLSHLRVDWYLEDPWVIPEIKRCFPSLRELHLLIDGKLFPLIVHELKDSHLEEFHLAYFETDSGVSEFDTNMTGLKGEDCLKLLEGDGYRNIDKNISLKAQPSLTDWKYLRTLDISYKKKNNDLDLEATDCVQLSGVAVWMGICHLSKLESLILRHFQIEEKFLLRMLKKLPLKHLCLSHCTVNYRSFPPRLETIQNKFPQVEMSYF